MTLEEQAAFLTEFEAWKAAKRFESNDFTPEQFLKERGRATAFDRLSKILDYAESIPEKERTGVEVYIIKVANGEFDE